MKKRSKFLLPAIALLLGIAVQQSVYGQSGCLVNSLNFSTGYSPTTGSVLSPPAYNGTTLADPKWTVIYETTTLSSVISSGFTEVTTGAAADIVPLPSGFYDYPNSDWISCLNANYIGSLTPTATYYATFSRTFTMAYCDDPVFTYTMITTNNYCDMYLDGTTYLGGGYVSGGGSSYATYSGPIPLSCGTHTVTMVSNPMYPTYTDGATNTWGTELEMTITSTLNSMVSESSSGCSTYTPCSIYGISGTKIACYPENITLTDVTTGGTWSSSNSDLPINSTSGVVTPSAAGTSTVTYTYGCVSTNCVVVSIASPTVTASPPVICSGYTTTLTATPVAVGETFTWSPTVASVNSPTTTATLTTSPTTYTVVTSYLGVSCPASATVTLGGGTISGPTNICTGIMATYTATATGGTWSSSNSALPINSLTGVMTPTTTGTTTIGYSNICGPITYTVTSTATPTVSVTSPPSAICTGHAYTLTGVSSASPGTATWTSSATGVASISSTTFTSAILTPVSVGTAVVTYSVTSSGGCSAATAFSVTAAVTPVADPITGPTSVCQYLTTTLADGTSGGTWSISSITIATISTTGIVTGLEGGSATVSYTVPSSTCGSAIATHTVSVVGQPAVCVSGAGGYEDGDPPYMISCAPTTLVTVVYEEGSSATGFPAAGFLAAPAPVIYTVTTTSWPVPVTNLSGTYFHYAIEILSYSLGSCTWTTPNCWAGTIVGSGGREASDSTLLGTVNTEPTVNNISLVPNPNKGVFTVEGTLTTMNKQAQLDIINDVGQRVYSTAAAIDNGNMHQSVTMDPDLPNGIYLVRISCDQWQQVIRFTLSR